MVEGVGKSKWNVGCGNTSPDNPSELLFRTIFDLIQEKLQSDLIFHGKMVTFYANPDKENEHWIERPAFEGSDFRIWHYIFFCFSAFTVLVILICCCVKIRIPRTKQEIEADYRRKKLADKFRQRLKLVQNQEMDALDLQRALEIIQEDYRKEQEKMNYCEYNIQAENFNAPSGKSFGKKVSEILKITKLSSNK